MDRFLNITSYFLYSSLEINTYVNVEVMYKCYFFCFQNSGLWQGRMVKRGKIPKNDLGDYWHWKDLNVGKDICIYGKVFHTVSCDLYTRVSSISLLI